MRSYVTASEEIGSWYICGMSFTERCALIKAKVVESELSNLVGFSSREEIPCENDIGDTGKIVSIRLRSADGGSWFVFVFKMTAMDSPLELLAVQADEDAV